MKMAENKMAEVAKLFGKKLDEEFKVKILQKREEYWCRFAYAGLEVAGWDKVYTKNDVWLLHELITGTAVIVDE